MKLLSDAFLRGINVQEIDYYGFYTVPGRDNIDRCFWNVF